MAGYGLSRLGHVHFSGYSSISFNEAARDMFTFFVAMDLFI